MIELTFTDDFSRLERALMQVASEQIPYAAARALNDAALAAAVAVNAAMPDVLDRPTPFTDRGAVAPPSLRATKGKLEAVVTMRPVQAAYLALEETGGTRTGAANTRKPAKSLLLPGKLDLDQYGNIPAGTLARLRRQALADKAARTRKRARKDSQEASPSVVFLPAAVPGNRAGIGGYFRRMPNDKLTRLTVFEASTSYRARLGYHARVEAAARATWPAAFARRLAEAIKSRR